jgi:hypothetical protein
MAEAYIMYFNATGKAADVNQAKIAAINALIDHAAFPGTGTREAQFEGTLWTSQSKANAPKGGYTRYKPGDQVWFENPYYNQGRALIRQKGIQDGLTGSALDKYVNDQASGEEGSNVFYLGVGTAGMTDSWGNDAGGKGLVISIYTGKVSTIEAYEHFLAYGTGRLDVTNLPAYDNTVQAVKDSGQIVNNGDFRIKRVRSVTDGSSL